MYPGEILNLFPPYPRNHIVFVAMSFDPAFYPRWKNVIETSINSTELDGNLLEAHRIDLSKKSDSIITEIVQQISQCRLVLADISTIGYSKRNFFSKKKPIRNANVMYEVGIAHATRLPEEVILLRSDNDPLDFDISGVRVHKYNPERVEEAIALIKDLVNNAFESIDTRKNITVRNAAESLDLNMFILLHKSINEIKHPSLNTWAEALGNIHTMQAINRLLSLGMFKVKYNKMTSEMFNKDLIGSISYTITPFGRDVYRVARERLEFNDALIEWLDTDEGKKFIDNAGPEK